MIKKDGLGVWFPAKNRERKREEKEKEKEREKERETESTVPKIIPLPPLVLIGYGIY